MGRYTPWKAPVAAPLLPRRAAELPPGAFNDRVAPSHSGSVSAPRSIDLPPSSLDSLLDLRTWWSMLCVGSGGSGCRPARHQLQRLSEARLPLLLERVELLAGEDAACPVGERCSCASSLASIGGAFRWAMAETAGDANVGAN